MKGKRLKLVPRAFIHEEVRKARIPQKRQRVRQKESQEQNIPRASQRKHIKWEWSTSQDVVAKWLLSRAEGWGVDHLSGSQSVTGDTVRAKCGGVAGVVNSEKSEDTEDHKDKALL